MKEMVANLAGRLARRLTRSFPRILFYHRFGPDGAFRRTGVGEFEQQIQHLRSLFTIVPLREIVQRLREGRPFDPNCVALTIDDGYADFLEFAYPLIRRYEVPVTVYLVSEFIERRTWWWADAIHWLCHAARSQARDLRLGAHKLRIHLQTEQERNLTWERLADAAVGLAESQRDEFLLRLESDLAVRLPETPTDEYRAMTWKEIGALDANLVELGAHTRTHPLLAACSGERQTDEIRGCKADIEEAIGRTVATFCYPFGTSHDFSSETVTIVKHAGFASAVTTRPGFIGRATSAYTLPRVPADLNRKSFARSLDGIGALKQAVSSRIDWAGSAKARGGALRVQSDCMMLDGDCPPRTQR